MAQAAKARLLAVDDNLDSAALVARIAISCGYDAQATSKPREVRKLLQAWHPAVLTLDLCMPDADGFDLISVLEESRFEGQVVIISGQDDRMRRLMRTLATVRGIAVAHDIQKPIGLDDLRQVLTGLRMTTYSSPVKPASVAVTPARDVLPR